MARGLAARLGRAHTNAVENLVPFSAIIVAAQTLGVSNRGTVAGATLFLVARVVHTVSYSTGITVLRSAAFYAGVFAILLVAAQLPWSSIYPPFRSNTGSLSKKIPSCPMPGASIHQRYYEG